MNPKELTNEQLAWELEKPCGGRENGIEFDLLREASRRLRAAATVRGDSRRTSMDRYQKLLADLRVHTWFHTLDTDDASELLSIVMQHIRAAATVPDGHVMLPGGKVVRVLGALPMTADGCIVAYGSVDLWCPSFPSVGKTEMYQSRRGTCRFYYPSTTTPLLNTWADVPIGQCYSTREAAAAAVKENA